MKVYLLSNYGGVADEGFKTFAVNLERELSRGHSVIHRNARRSLISPGFWLEIRRFRPQIVHILLRPSPSTLLMGRALRGYLRGARVLISALQPPLSYERIKRFSRWLKPDLVLTSYGKTRDMCQDLGWNVAALAGGVDGKRFSPVSREKKLELRKKYGIDQNKFVAIHVGPLRRNRNLSVLTQLQGLEGVQVLVVSNTSFAADNDVYSSLTEGNCLIWRRYLENLEEVLGLADCYVFPTIDDSACIELPLSMLEAMACNLPVIARRFGSLPNLFNEGQGLYFADGDADFPRLLSQARLESIPVKTRDMVMPYSWTNVAKKLDGIYTAVLPVLS